MAATAAAAAALLMIQLVLLLSESFEFVYNGFNESNMVEAGATVIKPSGALRLTNNSFNVTGHAFHPTPIPILSINSTTSFSTYFVFQIVPSTSNRGGYGLAFTLSPSTSFPGASPGHYLGVFNESNRYSPSKHIFMVEFDTVNGYNDTSDTDANHVGININGMNSTFQKPASYSVDGTGAKNEDFPLENYGPVQAWIDYDAFTKLVNVTVSPIRVVPKPLRPLITEVIDLSDVLLDTMYAGFSAATGQVSSYHYILGWSFRLNGTADPLDLSQLPVIPDEILMPSSSIDVQLKKALIATFSVILFVLLVSLLFTVFYRKVMKLEVMEDWELDCPHRFRYRDLHKATKGFNETEKIGSGGFGAVYKGVLPSTGAEVAVKKIMSNNPLQGMREFAAEIESLGRLRHKNLVNLQGWCKHNNDLILVYEYVSNGSLDSLLYTHSNPNLLLTWDQRFNIVKGVASGLLYLHEEWEQVVIHRDVKSSNVLIDHEMNPKLGDFGLARLYDHGKASHTTNVVGTIGYIAPELSRIGKASKGTDVFAYGILLLELACGRAPVVYEAARNVILVDWVAECMQMGNIFDAVDPKLNSSMYASEEMELVLGLGLLCSHPKPEARPTMRQVIKYLNGDEVMPLFDQLSSAGSRRLDQVTSRFLALALTADSDSITTTAGAATFASSSVGTISSASFESGR
ncbi:hypothetical protein ABFX02_12G180300 [Erythranthe guttata]